MYFLMEELYYFLNVSAIRSPMKENRARTNFPLSISILILLSVLPLIFLLAPQILLLAPQILLLVPQVSSLILRVLWLALQVFSQVLQVLLLILPLLPLVLLAQRIPNLIRIIYRKNVYIVPSRVGIALIK